MAALNYCSGCGRNFASAGMHAKHRAGSFSDDTRRCMADEELASAGFVMAVEPVRRMREGKDATEQMNTWNIPADEKALAHFAAMREKQTQEVEQSA